MKITPIRLNLSNRLVVDLQPNWGGWDLVITIYGKYDTVNVFEKMSLEWKDSVSVHKYLSDEGWISSDKPMNILESFKDFSEIDPNYKTSVDSKEELWKDSYDNDEPKDWQ